MELWPRNLVSAVLIMCFGTCLLRVQAAGTVVGNGTPQSCTEQAFDDALTDGGAVTFNCGVEPFTLVITSTKNISSNVAIDGGEKITLGGHDIRVILGIYPNVTVTLKNIAIVEGKKFDPPPLKVIRTPIKESFPPFPTLVPEGRKPLVNYAYEGGAILNDTGTLTLENVRLSHHKSHGIGSSLFNYGGRVMVNDLSITHTENLSNPGHSAIANVSHGTLMIDNSNISDTNFSSVIYNSEQGTATITNTTMENNRGNSFLNIDASLNLKNIILSNTQAQSNSYIVSRNGTLTLSSLTVSNSTGTAFDITGKGRVTIENSQFTRLRRSAVSVAEGPDVVISGSTFTAISAHQIAAVSIINANVTILDSTFDGGEGDAINLQGISTLGIFNSTISNYSGERFGNALNLTSGKLLIVNSTITHNVNAGIARTVNQGVAPEIIIRNSIFAFNSPNCAIPIIDGGNNLQFPDTSCGESIKSIDPLLDIKPGDNGGITPTFALLPHSPAIDVGNPSICLSPPINNLDQRGFLRSADGDSDGKAVCDIGAFEFNAKPSQTAVLGPTRIILPPLCPDVNNITDDTVRALIPDGALKDGVINCRVLITSAEIGLPSIIDRGIIRAAEVLALKNDGTGFTPEFDKEIKIQ